MENHHHLQNVVAPTSRSGLTLIELLASLSLAAILLVAITSTLKQIQKQHPNVAARTSWQTLLTAQLESDIRNSRRMVRHPTSLTLIGYAGRDANTGIATHQPVRITYSVSNVDQHPWLVRTEQSIASPSRKRARLICEGIASLELRKYDEARGAKMPQTNQSEPLPNGVIVTLFAIDQSVILQLPVVAK